MMSGATIGSPMPYPAAHKSGLSRKSTFQYQSPRPAPLAQTILKGLIYQRSVVDFRRTIEEIKTPDLQLALEQMGGIVPLF